MTNSFGDDILNTIMIKKCKNPTFSHLSDNHGTFIEVSKCGKQSMVSLFRYTVDKKQLVKMAFNVLFRRYPLALSFVLSTELRKELIKVLTNTR